MEVFIKVMNGLVMTLEEDKKFLWVWLLNYVSNFTDSRMKVPRYRSSPTSWDHFFLSVFSSSQVLAKITSIGSKLLSAACWSREEKRENCEANLLYVEIDFGEQLQNTPQLICISSQRFRTRKTHNKKNLVICKLPQTPQTNRSQCSSPVEALNLIVESKY